MESLFTFCPPLPPLRLDVNFHSGEKSIFFMSFTVAILSRKKPFLTGLMIFLFSVFLTAQNRKSYYQHKLDAYFSKDRNVKNFVGIDDKGISIYASATDKAAGKKPEIYLNWTETDSLKNVISLIPEKDLERLLITGKDGLKQYIKTDSLHPVIHTSLKGMKIAIDPGHIGGSFHMGETESRCMNLTIDSTKQVELVEGNLTFFTASLLKKKLEEQGAIVMLTRPDTGISSLGIGFYEWKKKMKNRGFSDSLLHLGLITEREVNLSRSRISDKNLFSDVFGPMDLSERAKKINAFRPDITVIIHYNVNEKNLGWHHPTPKDYVMTFVGGCITSKNLKTSAGRINLLRLLISPDIENSVCLSSNVVNALSTDLNVPIAQKTDASYLYEHCLSTPAEGVYSRDLALTRLIRGTLVYGEPLYQDNAKECCLLSGPDEKVDGCNLPQRLALVADAYYKGIFQYVNNSQKK